MKLIVGLGNPGKEYENTRHNIGYMVIENFAKNCGVNFDKEKFNGLWTKFNYFDEEVILLKPLSYMNLSGEVVSKFIDYFKISIDDILIISDDLDMDFLKIKLKYKGSCGGHNGLRNIEKHIGTQEYKRFKIGIANDKSVNTKDYVLSKFSEEDMKKINVIFDKTNEILTNYLKTDFNVLMSKYN